jgi:acetylcholinesterase
MSSRYVHLFLTTFLPIIQANNWLPNQASPLTITTPSGQLTGTTNTETSPNVAQFLGIPYAEDPVGSLRFSPPVPKSAFNSVFSASKLGPSCPQYNTSTPTFFSVASPEYYIEGPMAEECLSLNVWTPLNALKKNEGEEKEELPVIIFLHGGQFTVGGSRVKYHIPERWVERSQKHIVVTIKYAILSSDILFFTDTSSYRLNIFGFPNAKNLNSPSSNLGFLDQRLAYITLPFTVPY